MSNVAGAEKPNIVLFMVDQLSAKWVEAAIEHSIVPLPNIRRLTSEGVTFRNAFSSNPVCCPARATLATGLTTRGHGVLQNGYELDRQIPTFMRLLQEAEYRTGAFGKVHLQAHYSGVRHDYSVYGFNVVKNTEDPRAGEWLDWVRDNHPEHFEAALSTVVTAEHKDTIPDLLEPISPDETLVDRVLDLRERSTWDREAFPANNRFMHTLPFPEEISQTSWITSNAEAFIRETPPETPLCAQVSYVQPHSPSCPPGRLLPLVDVDRIPEPIPPEWSRQADAPVCFPTTEGAHAEIPENWRTLRHYYFADLAHLDEQLGRILDVLSETHRLENTFVFFLSDHGELLLDHGFTGKGERHYDGCVRIPFIASGPGVSEGETRNEAVQLEDVFPTILDIAGVRPKGPRVLFGLKENREAIEEKITSCYGQSLVPLFGDEPPEEWRKEVYIESYNNIDSFTPINWARTVRTPEWRYTWYPRGGGEQLFNLRDDPDETEDLSREKGFDDVKRDLLYTLLERVVDQDYPHPSRGLFSLGVH